MTNEIKKYSCSLEWDIPVMEPDEDGDYVNIDAIYMWLMDKYGKDIADDFLLSTKT